MTGGYGRVGGPDVALTPYPARVEGDEAVTQLLKRTTMDLLRISFVFTQDYLRTPRRFVREARTLGTASTSVPWGNSTLRGFFDRSSMSARSVTGCRSRTSRPICAWILRTTS